MTLVEKLAEVGLADPLSSLCGRRFILIDENNDEVFAGVIESIGITKQGSWRHNCWHDCVVIVPEGGRWKIEVDLDRNEKLDGVEKGLRWTLFFKDVSDRSIFTRLQLVS